MEIPVNNVLRKMEQELHRALLEKDDIKIREHLLIIQTLCTLVLEQQNKTEVAPITSSVIPNFKKTDPKQNLEQEEANGDSLFDF